MGESQHMDKMLPSPMPISKISFVLESLAATLQDGFIVTVLSQERMRSRALPTGDTIVAFLAASQFFLHRVQFSSVVKSCLTLCDPMDCSTPGLPVHHQLPEFTQTHVHRVGDAIQPSYPLPSPSPPALNLSQHQGLFHRVALHNNLANSGVSFKTSFEISWSFINSLTSWLTACLAVFRCAKIASFSHPVFFWMKWMVSWSVPRLLLGAPILSSPSVILSATRPPVLRQMVATQGSHGNHTG